MVEKKKGRELAELYIYAYLIRIHLDLQDNIMAQAWTPAGAYERERPYDELESEVDALHVVHPNHAPTS